MQQSIFKRSATALLGCILSATLLFSACQPTPEVAPVVNKKESDAALQQQSEYGAPASESNSAEEIVQEISTEPAVYKTDGHWKEELQKNEKFLVQADIDIQVPDLEKFPVHKINRKNFTQEDIDGFIEYFTKGDTSIKYYSYPPPKSKDDYEAEIINLKKSMAAVKAGADGETPESTEQYIKELEFRMQNAPEKKAVTYIEPVFTYSTDYQTGKPYKKLGENYMNLAYDDPETGALCQIFAGKYDEGKSTSNHFSFTKGSAESEHMYDYTKKYLKEDEARIQQIENDEERARMQKDLDTQKESYEKSMAAFSSNKLDIEKGKQKAVDILKELGISGVQINRISRALIGPIDPNSWTNPNYVWKQPTDTGLQFEFVREAGGLPCLNYMNGGYYEENNKPQNTYAPPFYIEQGSITLDENYELFDFNWSEPAILTQIVAEDSKLLPFEEISSKVIDQLFYANTYYFDKDNPYEKSTQKLRFEATEAKLYAAYTGAKDDFGAALIVPVWKINFQGYMTDDHPEWGTNGNEYMYNEQDVAINALDGSPVINPITTSYDTDMHTLEYEPGETPVPEPTDSPAAEAPLA